MNNTFSYFGLISGLIFTLLITISFGMRTDNTSTDGTPPLERGALSIDDTISDVLPQKIYSIDINKTYDLAGEVVPMNMDTRERLDRELSVNAYWHSSTLLNLKMSAKYFPTIERVLAEEGIPQDFKYLAVAESNLRNVSSGAAAKGFWQFRKLAAKEWKLEVNNEVDERYHIVKSTRAACKYLKHLKNRFGTWSNAAAAYNVGPTSFAKSMKTQGEDSFYDMNINEETGRYLFRIIAIKEIMSHPEKYGFYIQSGEQYSIMDQVEYVTVKSTIPDLGDWARARGISYRTLKYFNPWLISGKLTVKKNIYQIAIPINKRNY